MEKKWATPQKSAPKKVILIAGPTACGKTTLSLMLAKALGGEIVSADSMQVYRGMDIGTAKVSQEEQQLIPHHLLDIREIHESFNVVDFYREATHAIDSILARDRVPIVVGGSGFYFRSLLYGPPAGPPSDGSLRENLEEELDKRGPEALYQKLQQIDPTYAASITINDKQKIVRAFEIISLTGDKVSNLHWEREKPRDDYLFHCWFLHRPRDVLYKRIEERCDQMLDLGLIDEVKKLISVGLLTNSSASQAIGYRQVIEYLDTMQSSDDYEHFISDFKKQSRRYAKRQFTWFRKEPLFQWLNIEAHDFEIAMDMIASDYNNLA